MADSITISTTPPANPGLDYAVLKARGVELIQSLSGNVWTDYNEHDPGVTTLEQLCYALTELSYRASFPLENLLIDPAQGRIDTHAQALFIPRRILPCNPVTVNDYRKLLIDRVPEIGNVWLTPLKPADAPGGVNGLYDIAVYAPGADPCACDADYNPATIVERVRQAYCAHRDLCEDVDAAYVLDPVKTVVTASVSIDSTLAAEIILAAILFAIGEVFAPVPARRPLASLIEAGLSATEIFDGPLLRNGFIDDAELGPLPDCVTVSSVARAIARTAGVSGVRGVTVTMADNPPVAAGAVLVPPKSILALDTLPGPKGYSIRLLRNGIEVVPNSARVQSELARLKAVQGRTYPLSAQYPQFFGVPQGRVVDLIGYYSIQNQYPNVYGINKFGVPDDATTARRGQAKQLKGYLLPFEQLMADFLAQLSHARALFSIDPALGQTYFSQYLDASVPMAGPLLRADYKPGLDRIVQASDPVVARRNRFLDVLLALYGERLDAAMLVGAPGQPENDAQATNDLLHAKLAFLHALVAATRGRGRGFDYLAPAVPRNIAGMLIKSRIQLGLDPFPPRLRADLLAELGLQIVDTETEASIGRVIAGDDDTIEANFTPVPPPAPGDATSAAPSILQGQRVTEDFLAAAARRDNFRMGPLPGSGGIAVVCKQPGASRWRFAGRFADDAQARAAVDLLVQGAAPLAGAARQLQIVEHILLRDAATPPGEISFTITAVVIASRALAGDADFQTAVRAVVQANAPAAVLVEYAFLGPIEGALFEAAYAAWLAALRSGTAVVPAAALHQFLRDHRAPA
ncbi:MAG: hypothetical protein WDN03_08955 [Rhizomicrobium sp.]